MDGPVGVVKKYPRCDERGQERCQQEELRAGPRGCTRLGPIVALPRTPDPVGGPPPAEEEERSRVSGKDDNLVPVAGALVARQGAVAGEGVAPQRQTRPPGEPPGVARRRER